MDIIFRKNIFFKICRKKKLNYKQKWFGLAKPCILNKFLAFLFKIQTY